MWCNFNCQLKKIIFRKWLKSNAKKKILTFLLTVFSDVITQFYSKSSKSAGEFNDFFLSNYVLNFNRKHLFNFDTRFCFASNLTLSFSLSLSFLSQKHCLQAPVSPDFHRKIKYQIQHKKRRTLMADQKNRNVNDIAFNVSKVLGNNKYFKLFDDRIKSTNRAFCPALDDDWIGTEIENSKNKTPFNSINAK